MDPIRVVKSVEHLYRWDCTVCGASSSRWVLTKAEAVSAGAKHVAQVHPDLAQEESDVVG